MQEGKCSCECERKINHEVYRCLCKQSSGNMSMGMCVSHINQLSSRQLLVCIHTGSAPRSAKDRHPPIYMSVHDRSRLCMGVCASSSLSSSQLLVCVCMYMYVNTARWSQLHKAIILLLIIKYFVLEIFSYSQTNKPCNLIMK